LGHILTNSQTQSILHYYPATQYGNFLSFSDSTKAWNLILVFINDVFKEGKSERNYDGNYHDNYFILSLSTVSHRWCETV